VNNLFENPGRTKLALVSRGVALPAGLPQASHWVSQVNGTESVVDLRLPSGHFATVPLGQPYTELSPISLLPEDAEGCVRIVCGGQELPVQLLPAPRFYHQRSRNGARLGSFSSLHERLLLLQPLMGCGFFAENRQACLYCQYDSMLNDETPPLRDPLELVEVVHAALAEREVETVYLYNGFAPGEDAGLRRLAPVIALLRRHLGHRQIALETVAPRDLSVLDELYAAGLDIFVCNLEINDSQRFAHICPGKEANGGQEAIIAALAHARQVFRSGSVVSNLIVGLEGVESSKAGIDRLVELGVVPLLQPFRPLPGTSLAGHGSPDLAGMEEVFLHLYSRLKESQLPTHRLRHMGRVLTPMESRVLDGSAPTLPTQFVETPIGRRIESWSDALRRHLRRRGVEDGHEVRVELDRRPMHQVLASQAAPFLAMAVLALTTWLALGMQPPEGLSLEGWTALVIFVLSLILWVTQLLPLPVTSLLGMVLLPLCGVLKADDVYAMFGNKSVFFVLGAFILAAGLLKTGLSEHLALSVFRRIGNDPKRLLATLLLLPAVMSCFMMEHAVAAVLLPIVWSIVHGLKLRKGDPFGESIFFALVWGTVIGGVATLLGGARGPLAMGMVDKLAGHTFSFLDWTLAGLPVVIGALGVAWLILLRVTPFHAIDMAGAQALIEQRRLELGQPTFAARMMAGLMFVTLLAWVFLNKPLGIAVIALLAVAAMFALRIAKWREIQPHVDWGMLLMYGGAIAVASGLEGTDAAQWLAETYWPEGLSPWWVLVLLALMTLLLTEGISNAAAVAIMLPMGITIGASVGLDPVAVALAVGLASGFAFMLPMGTPANAMVFSTGYVDLGRMIRYGAILMVATMIFFALVTRYWWPLLGLVSYG